MSSKQQKGGKAGSKSKKDDEKESISALAATEAAKQEAARVQAVYEQKQLQETIDVLTMEAQRWRTLANDAIDKNKKQEEQVCVLFLCCIARIRSDELGCLLCSIRICCGTWILR